MRCSTRHRALALGMLAWAWLLASNATAQPRRDADSRYTDAHIDRVVFSPTAETHPQGTVFGSLYLVIPQIGFAPTQRLQLSVTALSDFKPDPGYFIEATVKANLLRTRNLRVAAITGIDLVRAVDGGVDTNLVFGRVGGTVQWCVEQACESSVNLSAMVVVFDKSDAVFPFGAALGFVGRLAGITKLLLEYGTLNSFSDGFPIDALPFWYAGYGLRFSQASWGLDVVFIRELSVTTPRQSRDGPELFDLLGVPLLIFTYRVGHD